ncbi:MAG: mechanosensitive ion channel [Anaerolineae bacterium]|nr:mechanosensitive ion channel [Anaerolineae bacterium]
MQDFLSQFIENFIAGIPNLLTALAIFIVSVYLARMISNIFRRVLNKRRAPEGVTHLLAQLILWSIVILGAITAIQRFFDVTAFLAGLGIIGFTIGFALQDVMKNLVSGIILLIQQPFHVGEVIGAAGFDGTVQQIDLRTTEMETTDGRIVTLPNASVLSNPIINYTRARRLRVDLSLSLPHTIDPNTTRQLVLDAIQGVPGFVNEPAPVVVFNNLTSSAMELIVNFWIDATKNKTANAKDSALLNVISVFGKQGIEVPHPVQMVYSKNG